MIKAERYTKRSRTRLFRVMQVLFAWGLVETVNPLGGNLLAGLSGAIYILVPWMWFYIAFHRITDKDVHRLLAGVEILAVLIAGYGLYQTFYGLLPFEMQWVDTAGYTALNVGGRLRAIGSFPSAQEYAGFCAMGFAIAVARLCTQSKWRILHFLVAVETIAAVIFESSRTVVFVIAAAVLVMTVTSRRAGGRRVAVGLLGFMAVVSFWLILPAIPTGVFGPYGGLIDHMINGLTNPLSPEDTGIGHVTRFVDGYASLLKNPVGYGLGSITGGANKFGGLNAGTEVDLSNMAAGLGLPGLLYTVIVCWAVVRSVRMAAQRRTFVFVATAGVLITCLWQWSNGGYYLIPVLVWSLVGWQERVAAREKGEDPQCASPLSSVHVSRMPTKSSAMN